MFSAATVHSTQPLAPAGCGHHARPSESTGAPEVLNAALRRILLSPNASPRPSYRRIGASGFFRRQLLPPAALDGAARRAWVRSVILDGVGCAGLALAAYTALDYVLAQPGVQSMLPQLGLYAAWAAAGLGCVYLAWAAWRGKTGASPY